MRSVKATKTIPVWLDSLTRNLIVDIINVLAEQHPDLLAVILYGSVARHDERPLGPHPSDVDLLAIFDSEDVLLAVNRSDSLAHTVGLAYDRHLDAPREVQVMFASRNLQEWDPTFIMNASSPLSQNSRERCFIYVMHSREFMMITGKEEHVVRQKNDASHCSER